MSSDETYAKLRARGAAGYFAKFANSELAKPLTKVTLSEVWQRPNLTLREHYLAHIGMMAVLNRPPQFREHLRGALANGVKPEEIVDIFCHTVMYAGMPAAVDAMMLLIEVMEEHKTA